MKLENYGKKSNFLARKPHLFVQKVGKKWKSYKYFVIKKINKFILDNRQTFSIQVLQLIIV